MTSTHKSGMNGSSPVPPHSMIGDLLVNRFLVETRAAIRLLWRAPAFSVGTIIVLAIAIGSSVAVFGIVDIIIFPELRVQAPERLIFVYSDNIASSACTIDRCRRFGENRELFLSVAFSARDRSWSREGVEVRPLVGEAVSSNYFDVLGVSAVFGRSLSRTDDAVDAPAVVVISDVIWRGAFNQSTSVLGQTLYVGVGQFATPYSVVGVMPSSFRGLHGALSPSDYWVPSSQRERDFRTWEPSLTERELSADVVVARLRPNVAIEQVRAYAALWDETDPGAPSRVGSLERRRSVVRAVNRTRLPFSAASAETVAMGLVTVTLAVLLVCIVNLIGILSARALTQRREAAIKLVLGGSQLQLVRQPLLESLLLSGCGTAIGFLAFRVIAVRLLSGMPGVPDAPELPLNLRVLLLTVSLWSVTAVCLALVPLRVAGAARPLDAVATGRMRSVRRRRLPLLETILIPQVALSLALLVPAFVAVGQIARLLASAPGYDVDAVGFVKVSRPIWPRPGSSGEQSRSFYAAEWSFMRRWLTLTQESPVVKASALTSSTPVDWSMAPFYRPGGVPRPVATAYVTKDYFQVLGILLLRGRVFTDTDSTDSPSVTIVDLALAKELWPDGDPLEKVVYSTNGDREPISVVGVVAEIRSPLSEGRSLPFAYRPLAQSGLRPQARFILASRSGPVSSLIRAVRDAAIQADPQVSVTRSGTLSGEIAQQRATRRLAAELLTACGILGLGLACVGCYGVMAYGVAQQDKELAIRSALGATRANILAGLLRGVVRIGVVGCLLGSALAVVALRIASHAAIALPQASLVAFAGVGLAVVASIIAAAYLSARRALLHDTAQGLREL